MGFRREEVGVRSKAEERARRGRGAAAEIRVVGAGVVVSENETRISRQVRIDATKDVGEWIVLEDSLAGARIGKAPRLQIVGEGIDVGGRRDRVRRTDKRSGRGGVHLLPFRIQEEEKTILEDRSADGEAVLLLLEFGEIGLAAGQALIARVAVRGAVELVGAGLGDGVDQQATEVALAHVERRQQHLVFLHRIEWNRLGVRLRSRLASSAQSEKIARGRAVDLDRVLSDVDAAAGEADAGRRRYLRYQRHEIREVAVQRRQTAKQR